VENQLAAGGLAGGGPATKVGAGGAGAAARIAAISSPRPTHISSVVPNPYTVVAVLIDLPE
jgi:hypothetical protein